MKSSKLLLTSLLAAAAMGANAFAETTTGTLLPTLGSSGTRVTYLTSTNKTADWQQGLGSSNISASVVANDLSVCSKLAEDGWHFSVDNKSTEDKSSDSSFTATGFTFTGRNAYGGEFVAATVDLNTLLGTDKKMTDISISFTGNVQTSSYFSVWSWDGTTATQLAKQQITTTAYSSTTENANVTFSASDLILTGTEKLFVVWSDNSKGSPNTISNLTSSYTASTFSTLYWRGNAEGETWSSSSMQWNSDSSAESGNVAATSLDEVIFDSSETVSVDSAGVAVDKLTISAGTVSFSGGKVAASHGFFVGNGGTLVLSSAKNLAGNLTVNAGGVFDLNGNADSVCYGEDTDGARLGTVYLNGGVLKDSLGNIDSLGNTTSIGRQLSKVVLTADSTVTAVTRHFGLAGAEWAPTELDLGGHTLTKDGAGTFLIITTTIKNGTLSVTEGKISDYNAGAVTLGANAVIDVKENGGVEYLTIASMAAGSALKLAGTTDNAVTLNNVAVGANAVVSLSGNSAVTGTITSMAAGSSLTLAGTNTSTVTISGAVAAGANIEVSNGNSVTYTGTSLAGNVTVSGTGSTFTQGGTSKADQLAASGSATGGTIQNTITVENGGTLDLADNRWSVKNGNAIVLDGGTITGTGQKTGEKYYGVLDFCGYDQNGNGGPINTVVVKNSFEKESFISGPVRLRSVGANFDIQGTAVLNITGRLANNGALQKSGSGTLVLDLADDAVETNEAFSGAVTLSEGKIVLKYSSALGTGTVTAAGSTGVNEVTLKVAEDSSGNALTIGNNISVSSGKTLILQSENNGNKLAGVISGAGSLKATYSTFTDEALTLAGDNTFSGGLEVAGVKVSAEHANALGSGMLKISDVSVMYPDHGTITFGGSVNAAAANVVLHDVSLLANNSAQLTAETDCSFTVAEGATLYLDIGALTDTVLTGDSVALTIAAASAFDNSFFSAVEVGTYGEDGSWVKDLQWAYVEGSWNVGAGTLSIAIPEPSMFGLLAGLGALALAGTRRRRRK